jgi:kynureninase
MYPILLTVAEVNKMKSFLLLLLFSLCMYLTQSWQYNKYFALSLSTTRLSSDSISASPQRIRKDNNRDKQWKTVLSNIDYIRKSSNEGDSLSPLVSLQEDPLLPQVESVVLAADDRKANEVKVLRVTHLTEVTRFMIVIEGNSNPQNQAIALSIEVKSTILLLVLFDLSLSAYKGCYG